MILSDEQTAAAMAGSLRNAWSWVPAFLPEGRQVLPAWLKGLHINWMLEYGNSPDIRIKVNSDVFRWPDQRWAAKPKGLHITEHPDGRARAYYHSGGISKKAIWRVCNRGQFYTHAWQVTDTTEQARAAADKNIAEIMAIGGPERMSGKREDANTLTAWIKPCVDVTEQQNGFGGDRILLTMLDGSERLLWGPWHGPTPRGYVEVGVIDMTSRYNSSAWYGTKPWHQRSGTAGLLISEDLFLRAVAHFAPHVRCAYVNHSYGVRLEPYQAEWGAPKAIWQARQQ